MQKAHPQLPNQWLAISSVAVDDAICIVTQADKSLIQNVFPAAR